MPKKNKSVFQQQVKVPPKPAPKMTLPKIPPKKIVTTPPKRNPTVFKPPIKMTTPPKQKLSNNLYVSKNPSVFAKKSYGIPTVPPKTEIKVNQALYSSLPRGLEKSGNVNIKSSLYGKENIKNAPSDKVQTDFVSSAGALVSTLLGGGKLYKVGLTDSVGASESKGDAFGKENPQTIPATKSPLYSGAGIQDTITAKVYNTATGAPVITDPNIPKTDSGGIIPSSGLPTIIINFPAPVDTGIIDKGSGGVGSSGGGSVASDSPLSGGGVGGSAGVKTEGNFLGLDTKKEFDTLKKNTPLILLALGIFLVVMLGLKKVKL